MTSIGGRDFAVQLKNVASNGLTPPKQKEFLKSVEDKFKNGPEITGDNQKAFLNEIGREYIKAGGLESELSGLVSLISTKNVKADFKKNFLNTINPMRMMIVAPTIKAMKKMEYIDLEYVNPKKQPPVTDKTRLLDALNLDLGVSEKSGLLNSKLKLDFVSIEKRLQGVDSVRRIHSVLYAITGQVKMDQLGSETYTQNVRAKLYSIVETRMNKVLEKLNIDLKDTNNANKKPEIIKKALSDIEDIKILKGFISTYGQRSAGVYEKGYFKPSDLSIDIDSTDYTRDSFENTKKGITGIKAHHKELLKDYAKTISGSNNYLINSEALMEESLSSMGYKPQDYKITPLKTPGGNEVKGLYVLELVTNKSEKVIEKSKLNVLEKANKLEDFNKLKELKKLEVSGGLVGLADFNRLKVYQELQAGAKIGTPGLADYNKLKEFNRKEELGGLAGLSDYNKLNAFKEKEKSAPLTVQTDIEEFAGLKQRETNHEFDSLKEFTTLKAREASGDFKSFKESDSFKGKLIEYNKLNAFKEKEKSAPLTVQSEIEAFTLLKQRETNHEFDSLKDFDTLKTRLTSPEFVKLKDFDKLKAREVSGDFNVSESAINSACDDFIRLKLKQTGQTPSLYQVEQAVAAKVTDPSFLRTTLNVSPSTVQNTATVVEESTIDFKEKIKGSDEFKLLEELSKKKSPFKEVQSLAVKLLNSIDLKTNDSIAKLSIDNIQKMVAVLSHPDALTDAQYMQSMSLLFEDLNVVLGTSKSTDNYNDIVSRIQSERIPSLSTYASDKLVKQNFMASSGMGAFTTALIASAKLNGGSNISQINSDESDYFEVPEVLDAMKNGNVLDKGEVLIAGLNPSTITPENKLRNGVDKVLEKLIPKLDTNALLDSSTRKPITLILDITIEKDKAELDKLFSNSKVKTAIENGDLNIIMWKSYQKYGSLGSGKIMSGGVTVINNGSAKFKDCNDFLKNASDSLGAESFKENKLMLHILKNANDSELSLVQNAAKNTKFVVTNCFNGGGADKTQGLSNDKLPFLMIEARNYDIGAEKLTTIDILNKLGVEPRDSFSFMMSSCLEAGGPIRVNIGHESEAALIEKFYAFGQIFKRPVTFDSIPATQGPIKKVKSDKVLDELDRFIAKTSKTPFETKFKDNIQASYLHFSASMFGELDLASRKKLITKFEHFLKDGIVNVSKDMKGKLTSDYFKLFDTKDIKGKIAKKEEKAPLLEKDKTLLEKKLITIDRILVLKEISDIDQKPELNRELQELESSLGSELAGGLLKSRTEQAIRRKTNEIATAKSDPELVALNSALSEINILRGKLNTLEGLEHGSPTPNMEDVPKRTILLNSVGFIAPHEKENLANIFTDQANLVKRFKVETSAEGLSEIYNPVLDKRIPKVTPIVADERAGLITTFKTLAPNPTEVTSDAFALIKEFNSI